MAIFLLPMSQRSTAQVGPGFITSQPLIGWLLIVRGGGKAAGRRFAGTVPVADVRVSVRERVSCSSSRGHIIYTAIRTRSLSSGSQPAGGWPGSGEGSTWNRRCRAATRIAVRASSSAGRNSTVRCSSVGTPIRLEMELIRGTSCNTYG
jgi:hypothetical protein